VSVLKIKLPKSTTKADGKMYLGLPPGYRECWSFMFDLNSNYASVEKNIIPQLDHSVTYELKWVLNPPNFGGNAWMDRIYMIAGSRIADPNAKCPPNP
jgi:hypothetical protein